MNNQEFIEHLVNQHKLDQTPTHKPQSLRLSEFYEDCLRNMTIQNYSKLRLI